jgi:hypothetical protein
MAKTGSTTRGGKDVAVVEDETAGLPAVYDYGDDAGAGFEGMGRDDYAMPFLYVLQPNSPIVTQDDNARPGMFMNMVTQDLFKAEKAKGAEHEGIRFIPCFRQHQLIEWKKRDEGGGGGGFVGIHEVGGPAEDWAKNNCKFGEWETQAGNDLIDTFYVYGLIQKADGGWDPVVMPFTSTKIKVYRHWMTRLKSIKVPKPGGGSVNPPLYAHIWRLTTVRLQNDQGVYYNIEVAFDGNNAAEARINPADPLFREARDFYELCRDGIAKPNYTVEEREATGTAGADVEVPF